MRELVGAGLGPARRGVVALLHIPTSLIGPHDDGTDVPDVATGKGDDRLGECSSVEPAAAPDIHGIRFYPENSGDLCRTGEVLGIVHRSTVEATGLFDLSARRRPQPTENSYSGATVTQLEGVQTLSEPARSIEGPNVAASGKRSAQSWTLIQGDCREEAALLEANSIDCVVTSPPYYWQRDYDVDGQIGMEASIQGFVDNIVGAMEGLKGALKPTGTLFLNLGDTYYNAKGRPHGEDAKHRSRRMSVLRAVDGPGLGLPRKSLIGIPWRVALAMQEAGWTLRSDIIWMRKSSIPEPTAKDRPWRKFEHVFMFTKSTKYHFDRTALVGEEDVWFIEPERNSLARGTHYAPYPRALVERCIAVGCPEGGTVLDPFVGGGTTMSVALDMGRDAVGIELNQTFCKHIASVLDTESE